MAITTLNSTDSGAVSRVTINDNFTDLDTTKADLASPTFTGAPTLPTGTTGVTQSPGDNSTKLATTAFVAVAASPITIETSTSTPYSLTTTAGQKVIVWARGVQRTGGGQQTVTLAYNAVTKDSVLVDSDADGNVVSLMYTETPGAATQNITLTTSGATLDSISFIIMKIG